MEQINDKYKWFDNIIDKGKLTDNLTFAGVFIAYFERLQQTTTEHLKGFFIDPGTNLLKENQSSNSFKKHVLSLRKYTYDSVFQWFVNMNAIDEEDYKTISKARVRRNYIAHHMDEFLIKGKTEEDSTLFSQIIEIYRKLDRWWINEIEIPTSMDFDQEEYDSSQVFSLESFILDIILASSTEQNISTS